ncbi:MAG: transketolase family protein [Coriobacteriales bacterium]|nr:transketolase family protein [Coriobacteriales bacterium]
MLYPYKNIDLPAKATREGYGETLVDLAKNGVNVYAVDADLSCSTTTAKLGKYEANRLVNVGISEQNMIGVAAGLALQNRIVFTGSFAVFGTGRCYDQIRNTVCYSKLNVKIAPTHSGVTVGPDGGSHQMLEDIALMRALPNMRVLVPADYYAAKAAVSIAAQNDGPFYIRLGRAKVPQVYTQDFSPRLGNAYVLKEGSDVTLAACGVEVDAALKAAEILESKGIYADVIDVFSIKPLDLETIVNSVSKTNALVTCEEHSVVGGLGSTLSEALSQCNPTRQLFIGVNDRFGVSGQPDGLLQKFGLDALSIAEKTIKFLNS